MTYVGEVLSIETYDGQVLTFAQGQAHILSYGNFGAPPTTFLTRTGYKQHGEREIDYTISPRFFSLQLYHPGPVSDSDRDGYWDVRSALHEYLRPNRGGPLLFTIVTPALKARSLYARAQPGLVLPPVPPESNDWSVNEIIDFTAYDPFWFDPEQVSDVITGTTSDDLVFPITFPIVFGFTGVLFTSTVNYTGTWRSYPTITLTGPYTQAVLEQTTTGAIIQLTVPISAGEERVLTLDPLDRSLVDGSGVSQWGDLGPADLINWYIAPSPEAPGGVNTLDLRLAGGSLGVSGVTIAYNTRYFAI